jgi:hypothetical protein
MFFICEPFGPVTVSGAFPIITVTPTMPTIPNTVSTGSTVAIITVTMSDGSTFTGTVAFGSPYFDDGGIYAISGSSSPFLLIVDPDGPGVGAEGGNIDNVTVVATQ